MHAFSFTYGTPWKPTGRRRHVPLEVNPRWPLGPRRTVMVLQLEHERLAWWGGAPPPPDSPPPANARRVTEWREARLLDLLPIEETPPR